MPVSSASTPVDWSTNSGGGRWMGRRALGVHRAALVDRLADHVDDAAERLRADRDADPVAGVLGRLPAHQAVGGVHRDAAHGVLAEVLRDLEHEVVRAVVDAGVGDPQRGVDLGQRAGRELDVHHRSHDLDDPAVLLRDLRRHLGSLLS